MLIEVLSFASKTLRKSKEGDHNKQKTNQETLIITNNSYGRYNLKHTNSPANSLMTRSFSCLPSLEGKTIASMFQNP